MALAAITLVTAYLLWRVLATLSPPEPRPRILLLLLEAWSLVTVAMQAIILWDVDTVRPPRSVTATDVTVTVLIPTADESHQVLMPTLAAATRMRLATEIIVLDDGHRPWLAGMCDELGIDYRTRVRREGGMAAQLNAVLPTLDTDYVVVLAADQVANRDFIGRTLAHFDDPSVALVQTPLDYYNEDSFEHVDRGRERFAEQNLFERVQGAGRNRLGAAYWNGGGAMLRRSALLAVGGVAAGSGAEGIETSIALHRAGWTSDPPQRGSRPRSRRGRRCRVRRSPFHRLFRRYAGAARREREPFGSGLTLGQRISYLSSLTDWLGAWRSLAYLLVPALALLLALTPAAGPVVLFTLLFPLALRRAPGRSPGTGPR